ncbi:MAG: cobaltochelatase subunit CobN [candidate division NC10 bacterium]|nr:cobaltochelatase subunit CobN [candidate division NC10 bacterium]
MKIAAIVWSSRVPTLMEAGKGVPEVSLQIRSLRDLEEPKRRQDFFRWVEEEGDLLLVYAPTNATWEEIESEISRLSRIVPTVCFGSDPQTWGYSSVDLKIAAQVNRYMAMDGVENLTQALRFLAHEVGGLALTYWEPQEIPWKGIYHPDSPTPYYHLRDYWGWYGGRGFREDDPTVGILFYRSYWINGNLALVDAVIRSLEERRIGVIPVFSYGFANRELNVAGNDETIELFFMKDGSPAIDLLLNLQSFFLVSLPKESVKGDIEAGMRTLRKLGVPTLNGLVAHYQTEGEWRANPHGLMTYAWSVAMPEFDGVIEPLILGAESREVDPLTGVTVERYEPIPERLSHGIARIERWIRLKRKPREERRVAFILHNNPCASVEATVGSGANLDTLESVARILRRLAQEGYSIVDPPTNGEKLIGQIMEKKAISDFRWTPVREIVSKGGYLALLPQEEYCRRFQALSPELQAKIVKTWGDPPGEAMVYGEKIVVTGLDFGHVVVCVQPKRGCLGARCDGQVCKILHDPACPPTHQYLATYWYLGEVFGADAIVHVGTHGNLEFLPGKSVGLSGDCFPDLAIGTMPHFYLYSVDNPPEGIIAKRRSYATLIDYMTPPMTDSGTYGAMKELEDFLGEYEQARVIDPSRAHALEHLIWEKIRELNLEGELHLKLPEGRGEETEGQHGHDDFQEVVRGCHLLLNRYRESQRNQGLHIFGSPPQGEERVDLIAALARFDYENQPSLRRIVFELMGLDFEEAEAHPESFCAQENKTYGELLAEAQQISKEFIRAFLEEEPACRRG